MATLDAIPDELVLYMLCVAGSPDVIGRLAASSRRYLFLASDDVLWKRLYLLHFGSSLHRHFEASGKTWRWLYQAQSRVPRPVGADVGGVVTRGRIYWGDTLDGLPHGYGLALCLPSHQRAPGTTLRLRRRSTVAEAGPADEPRYEGEWRAGLMHGFGRRVYKNGSRHEGMWEDDLPHGFGSRIDSAGWNHEGLWHKGMRCGHGTQTDRATGQVHVGMWVDDRLAGCTSVFRSNGETYTGDSNGNGYGVYTWPCSGSYKGDYKNNQWNGSGVRWWPDGRCYQGGFLDGKRHGYGITLYPDGHRYEGEFRDDRRCGLGVSVQPNGERFKGEYRDGSRNGYGVAEWHSGERYEGYYCDGKRQGYGVMAWANGNRYEGDFANDKRHGHGVYTWANGSRYVGSWRNSKMHGNGVMVWHNGNRYEGEWSDGDRHGYGVSTWTTPGREEYRRQDGIGPIDRRACVGCIQHRGSWLYDRAHGAGDSTYDDGSTLNGFWQEGALVAAYVKDHGIGSCAGGTCTCAARRASAVVSVESCGDLMAP
ncbi:Morn repeat domain containing protein [Pandoravirus neocaledonia]|uniref:Morn repeat domain containing protein n=1 Tax=Pandoravirus neocaledonia TaxID=2107708 RepID=A0A2U7UCA7_9VIRU|nr:Morn repeat domain containing protein [Pandoravirus neocaledonia]AVK76063.1 Morn repeat domain containing protein [Pandoravirus neocaledonia]